MLGRSSVLGAAPGTPQMDVQASTAKEHIPAMDAPMQVRNSCIRIDGLNVWWRLMDAPQMDGQGRARFKG